MYSKEADHTKCQDLLNGEWAPPKPSEHWRRDREVEGQVSTSNMAVIFLARLPKCSIGII